MNLFLMSIHACIVYHDILYLQVIQVELKFLKETTEEEHSKRTVDKTIICSMLEDNGNAVYYM